MAVITNATTSASINTAADLIADGNKYGRVSVVNMHASADLYINVGAAAASTGTIAGALIKAGLSLVVPVNGRQLSAASSTASVPVCFYEFID